MAPDCHPIGDETQSRMSSDDAPVAKDEELNTPEEKEAWLRAHGVEIESAEDRKKKAEAAAAAAHPLDHVEGVTRRVKYVRIPADDSEPFEQLEVILAHDAAGDQLPSAVQHRFIGGGAINERMAREQAIRQLGENGMALTDAALQNASAQGSTETFALVRASSTNGHTGVYLYLDEVGMLKGLAPNARAVGLARDCGFDGVQFYGDMFVGRIQAEPSPMCNVDFAVKDLSVGSDWLRSAAAENYKHNQSMSELQAAMKDKGGMTTVGFGGTSGDGEMPKGEGEGFKWTQTDDEVEVVVDAGEGTKAKDVWAVFRPDHVKVVVNGETKFEVGGDKPPGLFRKVRPDDCTWTIESGKVVVTLQKTDEQLWHDLIAVQ